MRLDYTNFRSKNQTFTSAVQKLQHCNHKWHEWANLPNELVLFDSLHSIIRVICIATNRINFPENSTLLIYESGVANGVDAIVGGTAVSTVLVGANSGIGVGVG